MVTLIGTDVDERFAYYRRSIKIKDDFIGIMSECWEDTYQEGLAKMAKMGKEINRLNEKLKAKVAPNKSEE